MLVSKARKAPIAAGLRKRLDEALQQQTATSDVLKVISRSTFDLQTVLDTLSESANHLCEADGAIIWRSKEGGRYTVAASYGLSPEFETSIRKVSLKPDGHSVVGRAVQAKRTLHIPDMYADPEYAAYDPKRIGEFRSMLGVPFMREGVPIGVMAVGRLTPKPFTDAQIALVTTFADQAVIAIENTRLLNELRQRTDELGEALEQQTATGEVLRIISTMPGDLQPVFDAILGNAIRICDAHHGILQIYDGENFHAQALRDVPPAYADVLRSEPRRAGPTTGLGRLVATRQPIHIADCAAEPAYAKRVRERVQAVELGGVRSSVVVPLLKGDTVLGGLQINRQEVRPFGDKQIELVASFAAQAVIAIENTRLLNELRESLQQQTATADVLKVISRSTFDLQMVLDTLVESAARLCEADMASINRQHGYAYRQIAHFGQSSAFEAFMAAHPIPAGRGSVVGRTIEEGKVVHIHDILADPEFTFTEAAKVGGLRTMLGVPMLREGTPIGVIVLQRRAVRPFTPKQIELVTTFSDQAVIAIENVRLFDSVEARTRELAKSLEELRTTQDRLVQTQKLALLGQLTAGIAHEIKNPLNFVNNFSGISAELIDELQDTLKGIPLGDKARAEIEELTNTLRSNFDKVVHHGRRADAIVKNMLQHSREGTGEHRVIDINALVEESLNLAWHGARAETQGFEIKLRQSFDPSAGQADVFPQDIRRALLNVISNGFYAATKRVAELNGGDYGPTITASTKSLGDRVEISICDNGTGMTPDVKEKMFNPFFTTKPTGEGTGLGLSISHDIIVKQHGGSIEVDTQPGEFTEIRVILPRNAVFL